MSTRPLRMRAAAVLGAAGLVTLTGCAAADLHPGAAAVVDGEEVSLEEANEFAEDFCDLNRPSLQQNATRVSMAEVRAFSLHLLVRDLLLHDFAAERGLEVGGDYRDAVSQLDEEAAQFGVPEQSVDTYVRFREAEEYGRAVLQAAGEAEGATGEEALGAGQAAFQEWVGTQDVDLDPRFGTLDEQFAYEPGGESLSVPVSEQARLGVTPPQPGQRSTEYVVTLPDAQVCA